MLFKYMYYSISFDHETTPVLELEEHIPQKAYFYTKTSTFTYTNLRCKA